MNSPKAKRPFVDNSPKTSVNKIELDMRANAAQDGVGAPVHTVNEINIIDSDQTWDRDDRASLPNLSLPPVTGTNSLLTPPADTVSRRSNR